MQISNNANKDDKSGEDSYKITTVRWSDWGEDYHKGFLTDSAKESGIDVKWGHTCSCRWADRNLCWLLTEIYQMHF